MAVRSRQRGLFPTCAYFGSSCRRPMDHWHCFLPIPAGLHRCWHSVQYPKEEDHDRLPLGGEGCESVVGGALSLKAPFANTAPDLSPRPGRHPRLGRDSEYKRMGTLSILAGLDLHDGHVTAEVHPRHRSREFILLLKALDAHYPPGGVIRLVLDNHSSHISKETMSWLATKPNRFLYVHTPKHGSWLNLVETLFGKMARTFLKHIRVASRQELKDRILLGIAEINEAPGDGRNLTP